MEGWKEGYRPIKVTISWRRNGIFTFIINCRRKGPFCWKWMRHVGINDTRDVV